MSEFAVVVPVFNEERRLRATLQALARQSDTDFSLIVVDNASTDGSRALAAQFCETCALASAHVIDEPQKGTGAASDTGFRAAIAAGARWIARTDADCLPREDWVRSLKQALVHERLEFVAGRIRPRTDEGPRSWYDRIAIELTLWLIENYGRVDPRRRGPQFKYPYFLAAGANLAISAALYEQSGGFPRTSIDRVHEDRALSERVRTLTARAALRDDVVVHMSSRRVQAHGYVNTLRWYRNHGHRPDVIDVR